MKCEICKKPEHQTDTHGRKRIMKHPANVTSIICSTCISEDIMKSRRRAWQPEN